MRDYGVARTVVETLLINDIDRLFLITGADQGLWIEAKNLGLDLVLARSEAGAVYMADGYARARRAPSAVYAQWGPGAANAAGALADALWSHSPVVAITSSMATDTAYRNEYQELDQLPLFESVTKWNRAATRPDRVGDFVTEAIRAATSGCPGPVHLDIPRDWLDLEGSGGTATRTQSGSKPAPDGGALARIRTMLMEAKRPVVLAGGGAVLGDASEPLLAVAERMKLPIATTASGKGAISETHSAAVGVCGRYSRKVANDVLAQADAVLVLGSRLGALSTDGYRLPSQDARIAQIDIDATALNSARNADIPVQSDIGLLLKGLLAEPWVPSTDQQLWYEGVSAAVERWREEVRKRVEGVSDIDALTGEQIIDTLASVAGPTDVVVADTAYMAAWAGALFPVRDPGPNFLRCGGSLGWAFPASIGVQMGRQADRVFCIVGDGGFGYHVGEIETALRTNAPVIALVFNNASFAFEYQVQKYLYENTIVPEVNDFLDIDHGKVAQAFGANGERVSCRNELSTALSRAIDHQGLSVIDIEISREEQAPVTTYEHVIERTV